MKTSEINNTTNNNVIYVWQVDKYVKQLSIHLYQLQNAGKGD